MRAWTKHLVAVALLAAGALPARPAHAAAACEKTNVCTVADLPAGCCPGLVNCEIDGEIAISTSPSCTPELDFGLRNLTVKSGGRIVLGSGQHLLIKSANFNVTRGKILSRGTPAGLPGGEVEIEATGDVSFTQDAEIDVSGGGDNSIGGGRFIVTAGGQLTVNASTIRADGYVTNNNVGYAGEIRLTTNGGPMTMSGNPLELTAEGGGDGRITLDSAGAVSIGTTGRLRTSVATGGLGLGGTIEVTGASITSSAIIEAIGGFGDIILTATAGPLAVDRDVFGLSVDAADAPDVDQAGTIMLVTEQLGTGTIRVDAPLNARGFQGDVGGGQVTLDSAATVSFSTVPSNTDTINVSGFGSGSEVEITAVGDVTLRGDLLGPDDFTAALITIESGRNVRIGGHWTLVGRTGFDAEGGEVIVEAAQDVVVERGAVIDLTGAGGSDGGTIDVAAGRHITVEAASGGQSAANLVSGSGSFGGTGGSITLSAGVKDARGFDQTGDVTMGGVLAANAIGTTSNAGSVDLRGCQVDVTGTIDTTATVGFTGTNAIVARKTLHLGQNAMVRARASNSTEHVSGTPPVVDPGATVTPGFISTPHPQCTTGIGVPSVDCLPPCPTCGDASVQGPWEECEQTGANHCVDPNQCNDRCRRDDDCASTLCEDALCDPAGGCFRLNKPNGTDCTDPGAVFCDGPKECQIGACIQTAPPNPLCTCNEAQQILCPDTDGDPCTVNGSCGETGCTFETIPAPACCHNTPECGQECAVCTNNTCELIDGCCLADADCEDGNPCTTNTCNTGSKTCNAAVPLNGAQVGCGTPDPENPSCMIGTQCVAGTCDPGTLPACPDENPSDPCTEEVYDSSGCCVHQLLSEACCSDVRTICPGVVNACTEITCNATHECEEDTEPGCTPCTSDANCDPVTPGLCGTSVCRQGRCQPNTPPDCTDGDLMTDDECVVANGHADCTHTCIDDRPCSDGNVCNGVESRVNCRCTTTTPALTCTGTDPCTEYSCNPASGCTETVTTLAPGVACRLGVFTEALAGLTPQQISKGTKKKMTKLAATIRTKTQASTTGSVKARTKAAKTAQAQLKALTKLLNKQKKIPAATLQTMRDALQKTDTELAGVRAAITS